MKWFERHLNWTWILVCEFATLVGLVCGWLLGWGISAIAADTIADLTMLISWLIISTGIIIGVTWWLLRKKGKSLWNLFWLIVPFGFIPLLDLNKKL